MDRPSWVADPYQMAQWEPHPPVRPHPVEPTDYFGNAFFERAPRVKVEHALSMQAGMSAMQMMAGPGE